MKIVKRIEDIQGDMWCSATKENYEFLKKLGAKFSYESFEDYRNQKEFKNDDIFRFTKQSYNDLDVYWWANSHKEGIQFICNHIEYSLIKELGFQEPETFKVEILKIYNDSKEKEYIGTVNNNVPAKWNSEGICLNLSSEYNLYKEYKQQIYTKPNSMGFYPKQKFIISSTVKMSISLEKQGWRLATNEEIEGFKNEDK